MSTMTMQEFGRRLRREYQGPIIATDIIIEYNHEEHGPGVLLIERKYPPLGIAIPGGMAEPGLSLAENAVKEAKEETGLDDIIIYSPNRPLCEHSRPDRDPRAHIASVTYVARGRGTLDTSVEHDDAKRVRHYTFPQLDELVEMGTFAFDSHRDALRIYLDTRRAR